MTLREALAAGEMFGKPLKVYDPLISNVFIFEDKAIKVYKHEKAYYADLIEKNSRLAFYKDDFFWNQTLSPLVYKRLVGVTEKGGAWTEVALEEADDWYIEMAVIDGTKHLAFLLERGEVSPEILSEIADTVLTKQRELTAARRDSFVEFFEQSLEQLLLADWENMRQWLHLAEAHIPKSQTDALVDEMQRRVSTDPYFKLKDAPDVQINIDSNCDNILVLDGKPAFIDVMPPLPRWRVNMEGFVMARIATDAHVLGTESLGASVWDAFEKNLTYEFNPHAKLLCEVRAGCVQWAYRHMLGEHERAAKYRMFTMDKFDEISKFEF
jgi:aminoglycoside phosphotransferase family enzyme